MFASGNIMCDTYGPDKLFKSKYNEIKILTNLNSICIAFVHVVLLLSYDEISIDTYKPSNYH